MAATMTAERHRAQILDGRPIADEIKKEVAAEVHELREKHGVTPKLAAVLVGDDMASAVYVRNKVTACEEVGIGSEQIALPAATSTEELLDVVRKLNSDDATDGILVQLPLPTQIDDTDII